MADSGARTVDQIGDLSAAGTECGKCRRNIARILGATTQNLAARQLDLGDSHARQPANH